MTVTFNIIKKLDMKLTSCQRNIIFHVQKECTDPYDKIYNSISQSVRNLQNLNLGE